MVLSDRGLRMIQNFEGLRLVAYNNGTGVETIGFGHTGPDVTPGLVITPDQAAALLQKDLERTIEDVNGLVAVPVTQGQFDALVSFAYNVGLQAFGNSTLLRLINEGDLVAAAKEFAKWDHAGGREIPGLAARRAAEAALFSGSVIADDDSPFLGIARG